MKREDRARIFSAELWLWFQKNKRTLPWRDLTEKDDNRRAYLVFVSEIMLQQTQVSRVIELYQKFVRTFPHIKDLAAASNADILRAWKGLGYNSRALRLRDAARLVVQEHAGQFPRTVAELVRIKGIGEYTAGAILNFAFDVPTPCIDVNIRRIMHRLFFGPENDDGTWHRSDTELLPLVALIQNKALMLPGWSAKDVLGALMDFGSSLCTKNSPKWDEFPDGMKTAFSAFGSTIVRVQKVNNKEPGRIIAGTFVPERILRGRIIDVLRKKKATKAEIGRTVITDWSKKRDAWLQKVLTKLEKDSLLTCTKGTYHL
ncbi:MAG: hypothetical protein ABL890_00105 [Candidatus Peribacteraceae bacterium]